MVEVKAFLSSLNDYIRNYSHDFFNLIKTDIKIKKIYENYLSNIDELWKLRNGKDKDKYEVYLDELLETNLKEAVYFVIAFKIQNHDRNIDKVISKIDFDKLTTKIALSKLAPFRLYSMTKLAMLHTEDKSSDGDIYYKNRLFHSQQELYTFLCYEYLSNPFLVTNQKYTERNSLLNRIKNMPHDIKEVFLLSLFTHWSTHKAQPTYIDVFKLFFNNRQAEFNLGYDFKDLYQEMFKCLKELGGDFSNAADLLLDAVNVCDARYSKSGKIYSELYNDKSFLGQDDETLYEIESRLNSEKYPNLVNRVKNNVKKICTKNEYFSSIDKDSDRLVKKMCDLLSNFSNKNFELIKELHTLMDKTYKKSEELLTVTLNKIKDMRSYESLSLCFVMNLCGIDVFASKAYIQKYLYFDVNIRKDIDKLAFNYSKFLKYYLLTGDYDKDTNILNDPRDIVLDDYHKIFETVSDFTNYYINRIEFSKAVTGKDISNSKYEAAYIVNNLFLFFIYNNSLDASIKLNYNLYGTFDNLVSALHDCNLDDVVEILGPVLEMVSKEIEKNPVKVKTDFNLEEILDAAQLIKLNRCQEKLHGLHSVEEYQSKVRSYCDTLGLLS